KLFNLQRVCFHACCSRSSGVGKIFSSRRRHQVIYEPIIHRQVRLRLYKTYSIHRAGCRTGKERCAHAAQGRAFSTAYVHLVNLKKMKKLYPSGQAMPTRTGPSEPKQSSHDTSHERMTTSLRSLLRVRSISPFHSHRWRAMVSTRAKSGSTLYGVLQRRGWLAMFSPRAVANRTKVYTKAAQQSICATRTPAKNVALKDFLRRAPLRSGLAIVRGSTTVLPNIFMVRRAHLAIEPNHDAARTHANNAALEGLAIATPAPTRRRGGTTGVPNRACELPEGNI